MTEKDYDWEWEETVSGRPGMSGDLAKLFRHEEPKNPGVFEVARPTAAATLLAREVIQNSWDAARELQVADPTAPQFRIDFRFEELVDQAKARLSEALRLDSLATRVASLDRKKVGLRSSDCLDSLAEPEAPLRILRILESGASGMYGPWSQNKSHMFLALLSIGFTEKMSGAGGSYGYGKAGLINGSRIRSVIAYSCFREQPDEPGVTRRLLGVTYWGEHDVNGVNHPGIGSLSTGSAGEIEPFENEAADAMAEGMGLRLRDPAVPEDLGTSFLLIDTPIDPFDLLRAIERSWWPAIQEGDFSVNIVDSAGEMHQPRPKRDPVLHTFIEAWELAVGRSDPSSDEYASDLTGPSDPILREEDAIEHVGRLGLVSDLSGWSYADYAAGPEDQEVSHKSLVALTRGTRMVVEYLVTGHSPPYLRGAFIADPELDDVLRSTEPKAHDAWQTKGEESEVDSRAAAMAAHVIKRIKTAVQNHRQRVKPPTPPPEEVNLPFFNEIMSKVMSGMGKGVRQPVAETRPLSIHLDYQPRASGAEGRVELAGTARYSLSEHFEGEAARVEVTLSYRFIEDERVGDHARLDITAPPGFLAKGDDGVFQGELKRDQEASFEFVSEPYDPNWSGRLIVDGEVMKDVSAEQTTA